MLDKVLKLFNIRTEESNPFFWISLHAFFNGFIFVFFETVASTLFLSKYGTDILPYIYISSAGVIAVLGVVYSRLESKLSFTKLMLTNLFFILIVIFGLNCVATMTNAKWPALALFIFNEVLLVLMSLEFWGVAGRLFNVRQGKRLFGLIGSFEVIGSILGGLAVPYLLLLPGKMNLPGNSTAYLNYFSIIFLVLSIGALIRIIKKFSARLIIEEDEDSVSEKMSIKEMLKNRYLVMIFILSGISVFGYFFIDFAYYEQIEARYPDEAQLAAFIGKYQAILNCVILVFQGFLSGRLLNKYGLTVGLLGLPAALTLAVIIMISVNFIPAYMSYFFFATLLVQILDCAIRPAFEEPSVLLLYQPLTPSARTGAQAATETLFEPIANALAGAFLLIMGFMFDLKAIHMGYCLLVILPCWIIIGIMLKRYYPVMLQKALSKRSFSDEEMTLDSPENIELLKKSLCGENPGEIIYALNMLEKINYPGLDNLLVGLISHPLPLVREETLKRIEKHNVSSAFIPIINHIDKEETDTVKGAALRVISAIGEDGALEKVSEYISHENYTIRKGAMVGLLKSGGIEGVLLSGELLTSLINSEDPLDRIFAAEILGEVGIKSFYRPLMTLITDEDVRVRRTAIQSAGILQNVKLLPMITEALTDDGARSTAAISLVKYGNDAAPFLENSFNRSNIPLVVQIRIARIFGNIKESLAFEFLKKNMNYPNATIRGYILSSLVNHGYNIQDSQSEHIRKMIFNEANTAARSLKVILEFSNNESMLLINEALGSELKILIQRLFSCLTFIYPPESIRSVRTNLESQSADKKAYALEIIDSLVSQNYKEILFPLIDDLPNEQRLSKLEHLFPQETLLINDRIKDIIDWEKRECSFWLRACAIYYAGKNILNECTDAVTRALTDSNQLIRETSIWALSRINPEDLIETLHQFINDPSHSVSLVARTALETAGIMHFSVKQRLSKIPKNCEIDLLTGIIKDNTDRYARRCRAIEMLSHYNNSAASETLLSLFNTDDETIKSAALRSALNLDVTPDNKNIIEINNGIDAEIEDISDTLSYIDSINAFPEISDIGIMFEDELTENKIRIISLISLLSSGKKTFTSLYFHSVTKRQSNSKETTDILYSELARLNIKSDLRLIEYILTAPNTSELIRLWRKTSPLKKNIGRDEIISSVAFSSEKHIRICTIATAIRYIGKLDLTKYLEKLKELANNSEPLIRETAIWAIYKISPALFNDIKKNLKHDDNAIVAELAK